MSRHNRTIVIYHFDDEYRITSFDEASVTRIERLVKRKKYKEWWETVFHSHTSLLARITEFATSENTTKQDELTATTN